MMIVRFINPCEHCGGSHEGRGGHQLTARENFDELVEQCRRNIAHEQALKQKRAEQAEPQPLNPREF